MRSAVVAVSAAEGEMGYVIAAYAVVLGTLVVYGVRLHLRRRALVRRDASEAAGAEERQ